MNKSILRGDLYYADLNPVIGSEQGGIRPVLVIQNDVAGMCKAPIIPYFKEKAFKLNDLKPKDIQDFYTLQLKRVKASTVIHYHSVIHKALKYAVKIDLIPVNPASKIERPRQERFVGSFYDSHETKQHKKTSVGNSDIHG